MFKICKNCGALKDKQVEDFRDCCPPGRVDDVSTRYGHMYKRCGICGQQDPEYIDLPQDKKLVMVELVDRFKIVIHNKDTHFGCFYTEDEYDITIYAPTIENLVMQMFTAMIWRLITVGEWELEQCQTLVYKGNVYEIEDLAKDIEAEHSTLVDDLISTDLYKEAYKIRQKNHAEELLKAQQRFK